MVGRAAIVLVLLSVTGLFGSLTGSAETVVPREPLAALPLDVGDWHGQEAPLAEEVLTQLGADDYVNRQYARSGAAPIGLYVAYYASQRQGDMIHSPQNCLPGAGWIPLEASIANLRVGEGAISVNHYVIQNGLDRQAVFYWYQGRGRVVANEYQNKALLMLDAARLHRTNGGLVRVIAPITSTAEAATAELSAFTRLLFPYLDGHLP